MIIKICRRDDPYARIDNRALGDRRLSYRARGLLAYLLSKPPTWKPRAEEIVKDAIEGRDAIRTAFKELKRYGYAVLRQTRAGKEWTIYEVPEAKDGFSGDGPCPEKANIGKTAHIVTKEKNSNERPVAGSDSDFAKRIRALMHRREATGFSDKEAKSFKKIEKMITDDDLCMVERYYARNWPPSRDRNILRHDVYTFLNNWHGEVDRALQWCEKHPLPTKRRLVNLPGNVITSEPTTTPVDPEETAKFIASFEAHFHRLPHGYSRVNGEVVYINGATQ